MMYDTVTYDNAEAAASRMTDAELINAHLDYMQRDGVILAGGENRRGLVDDPYWSYIKFEARRRGIDLAAAYAASIR